MNTENLTSSLYKVNTSIDRVVVNIEIPDNTEVNKYLDRNIIDDLNLMDMEYIKEEDIKFYEYNFKYDNSYISFGFKGSEEKNNIRLEFNPNNQDLNNLSTFVKYLPNKQIKFIRYNRIDYAIDYRGIRLYPEYFAHPYKRKGCYFFDGDKFQTLYLGSKNSDIQIRIYDKKEEVLQKNKNDEKEQMRKLDNDLLSDCWRIEGQFRKKVIRKINNENYNPFENLICYKAFSQGYNLSFRNQMFFDSVNYRGLQQTLKLISDSKTKRIYMDLLERLGIKFEHPSGIFKENYQKDFKKLDSDFRRMISESQKVPF